MRGTNEQFDCILSELNKNIRAYEEKKIKHHQYVDAADNIFQSYGWSKSEFYKEVNFRLDIQTNETREKKKTLEAFKKKISSNLR